MEQFKDLSLTELKAMAYDCIARKEQEESNLRILNNEIVQRLQAASQMQIVQPEEKK